MPYNNNNYGGNGGYQGGGRSGGYGSPRNSTPRTSSLPPQASTTGIQLTNTRAGRFLNFNFWGRYGTIAIGAVPPGQAITWDVVKNTQAVQQNLQFGDLSELQDICEEVMESLKNAGTFTSTAIKCTNNKGTECMVEISNGTNLNLGMGLYLVIYKNLDSGNRAGQIEYYPFSETKVIRGYDPNTGAGKEDIIKVGEFKKFYRAVKEATKAFTMAQAHAVSVNQNNDRLSIFKALAAMTGALGIDMTKELDAVAKGTSRSGSSQRGSGGGYGSRGGYSGQQSNNRYPPKTFEPAGAASGGYNPPMTASVDDPVDITLSLDNLTNVDMSQFS